jgi:hypothetical protein
MILAVRYLVEVTVSVMGAYLATVGVENSITTHEADVAYLLSPVINSAEIRHSASNGDRCAAAIR